MKMFSYDPTTKLEERDYAKTGLWTTRAPMLALSNPDLALAFPPDITLQPQLFVRNVTRKPIDATLRFNWRSDSSTGTASGPNLRLAPLETRLVDIAALQTAGILPKEANWTSVALTTNGLPDEVVAVAASYDKTLRYGAQTPFSDQLSFKWEGGMWQYDPYHNSIITTGNGGTKPTTAAFTIFYNQGTQRYDLEQTLQPGEQMWIDIGKLIREKVPDKNGNVLPPDLTTGSYEFRDLTNTGVGKLFEGKITYDKTYGHVAYGCGTCCGYATPKVFYNPLGVPLAFTAGNGVNAYENCSLTWDDVSDSFYNNWYSNNTAIVTVDAYGTHTGISLGSTTSRTLGWLDGVKHAPQCPQQQYSPSGSVNVIPNISGPNTVWYFNNLTVSGYATSIQLTSNGGSSSTWTVTAGANKVNLSSYTGSTITVTSSGTAFSSAPGDVKITVTANQQTSSPFSLTTRVPIEYLPGTISTACDSKYGYITTITYDIRDNLIQPMPSAVPFNENFTTAMINDYPGGTTGWNTGSLPGGATTIAPDYSETWDYISGGINNPSPKPTCDGNSTPVEHIGQEWRVGSVAPGFGHRVQTDTIQQYIGHGAHVGITSPAP